MQGFIIFYRSLLVYIISVVAKTCAKNGAYIVLGIRIASTITFISWFDLA